MYENTITRPVCLDCGEVSLPWFGLVSYCPKSTMGNHRATGRRDVSRSYVAERLREHICNCPDWERRRFAESDSSLANYARKLILEAHP